MKLNLTILLIIFSNSFFFGQEDSIFVFLESDSLYVLKNNCHIASTNIVFTKKGFIENKILGFQFSGNACGTGFLGHCSYRSFSYYQILPIQKSIDSLSSNLTGFFISYLDGVNLLNRSNNFDMGLMLGLEFGRLRLYGNPLLRKKNGCFAPKIEIQPKIKLKRLVIGGSFGYAYDITNPNWKNTWFSKDKSYSLDKLRQSGFSWQMFLGWSFY